ncbi:MAG: amidohydrolase [Oscillospiraceae bacterium]|nr:amidohydrolase [Oscillospiraceae bacterium]
MYIDFHTHAFSDKIVEKAMAGLTATSGFSPCTDGSLGGLIDKMKETGVSGAVLLTIATKPTQHEVINSWAAEVNNKNGIYAFGSVHPDGDDALEWLDKIKEMGLYGIKLHPDYQNFIVDDEKVFPIYEKCSEMKMPVLFHAGYDPLSPDFIHCTPEGLKNVHKAFPDLIMICAHMGGMYRWEQVERHLVGRPGNIYFDLGVVAGEIGEDILMRIIRKHGPKRILLGSDCPWDDPENEIEMVKKLPLSDEEKEYIFYKNAQKLLGI